MFLVFSLQRLCKKSVLERKQIGNKAEKGYLKFCLDRQREIFEIFYWRCTRGVSVPGTTGNAFCCHIPFIALKMLCLELFRTPLKITMPFLSNECLPGASANIYVADPTNPGLFVCPSGVGAHQKARTVGF